MLEYFPQCFDVINISDAIFPSEIFFFLYFTVMTGCITCDLYLLITYLEFISSSFQLEPVLNGRYQP